MKQIIEFLLSLKFIFKPSYWFMNDLYDKRVDLIMQKLLDKYEFTEINDYYAKLGNAQVWIANMPYCVHFEDNKLCNLRPSRLTIEKVVIAIYKQQREAQTKEIEKFIDKYL